MSAELSALRGGAPRPPRRAPLPAEAAPIVGFRGVHARLSNLSPDPAWWADVLYPTAEHALAAARLGDPRRRAVILGTPSPLEARELAAGMAEEPWSRDAAVAAMAAVAASKFSRSVPRRVLLRTGGAPLVNANTLHDGFFGTCVCADPDCPAKPGMNYLGIILVSVRATLAVAAARRD